MEMTVDRLSGDSHASIVGYTDGRVLVRYEDYESDTDYLLKITAQRFVSEKPVEDLAACVVIDRLADHLPVEPKSGMYVAPEGFPSLMRAARKGYHLAIGQKADEYPLFLTVQGYGILIGCPIRGLSDVEVRRIEDGDA